MVAYLINHLRIPGGVPTEEGLSYLEKVEGTARPYGGKWLAQGPVEVVEGAWPDSAVLMEFPSIDAARQWYNSPEYAEIRPLRVNSSINDLVFIDGVAPGFTVAGFAQQVRASIAAAGAED
jgi:uncharacterized protein (DUF1330 family)